MQGVVIIMPRLGTKAKAGAPRPPKWRKLTTMVLEKHGGVLSMKKLRARVLALAAQRGAEGGDGLAKEWLAVVDRSSKFVIDGRNVRLR